MAAGKIKLLFCDIFKEELQLLDPPQDQYDTEYLACGLHYHPAKLHQEIQEALNRSEGYSRVVLGFGLCGGSLSEIKAANCPLVIPRVHDCLPVLLGAKEKYQELQHRENRTFYFSGGWVEGERMFIHEYERSCIKFGPKKALRIFRMMFENYTRMMYIHTGHPRDGSSLEKTREFAGIFDLPCMETRGSLDYLKKLVFGPWDAYEFVTVPAHDTVREEEFLKDGEEITVQGGGIGWL